jgi:hypothetical protein
VSQCRALPILASGISDDHRLATSFNPTGHSKRKSRRTPANPRMMPTTFHVDETRRVKPQAPAAIVAIWYLLKIGQVGDEMRSSHRTTGRLEIGNYV